MGGEGYQWGHGHLPALEDLRNNATLPYSPHPDHPTWKTPFTYDLDKVGRMPVTVFVIIALAGMIMFILGITCVDICRRRRTQQLHAEFEDGFGIIVKASRYAFKAVGRFFLSLWTRKAWTRFAQGLWGLVKSTGKALGALCMGVGYTIASVLWIVLACGFCGIWPMPWKLTDDEKRRVAEADRDDLLKAGITSRPARQETSRKPRAQKYDSRSQGMDLEKGDVQIESQRNSGTPVNEKACQMCRSCSDSSSTAKLSESPKESLKGKEKQVHFDHEPSQNMPPVTPAGDDFDSDIRLPLTESAAESSKTAQGRGMLDV